MITSGLPASVVFAAVICLGDLPAAAAPDFARDVRPILEKHCYGCHGPEKQKSGYRLDVRDIALKGGDSGKRAIVPHEAGGSLLIRYVSGEDPDTVMPRWPLARGKSSSSGVTSKTEFKLVISRTRRTSRVTFFNLNSIPLD